MTQCQPVRIGGAGVGHDVEKGVTALLAEPVFKRASSEAGNSANESRSLTSCTGRQSAAA